MSAFTLSIRLSAVALLLLPGSAVAQAASMRGTIIDAASARPVVGADVSLDDGVAQVASGPDGRFLFTNLRPDTYLLRVSRLGYEEAVIEVTVGEAAREPLTVYLTPAALELAAITVSPGTFAFGGASPSARQTMSRAEIDAVPQFAEDIFRAVNRLPGLTAPDFTSRFSIRGGRPDETLIRIDGLEIYEPYHLKDFNDGAISIVDSELIEGVQMRTGGFPVRYGNYTSGVFSIETREPTSEGPRIGLGASLMNLRGMAEGRFGNDKGSYLLSGRRGYLDLILGLLGESGVPSPAYHDVFAKADYGFSAGHSITLNALQASDRWTFDASSTTGFADSIPTREDARNRYGNAYVWATHRLALTEGTTARTIVSLGRVTSRRKGGEYYSDGSPIYDITARRTLRVLGIRQEWTVSLADRVVAELGADLRDLSVDHRFLNIVDQDPDNPFPDTTAFFPTRQEESLHRDGTTFGAYGAARVRLMDRLVTEVGLRYDRSDYTGDRDVSPRINALIPFGTNTSLRLGWGVFRQMQGLAEVSILDPALGYHPSERSRQWTASLEHLFGDGGVLRVEAYRKHGDALRPAFRNWKGGLDVFPETNEDRILVYPERSLATGIELFVQKHLNDRISLRGSYGLASIEETVAAIENVNDPYPLRFDRIHGAPQDQRHTLNVDATVRPWLNWSMTGALALHSGWPGTLQHEESFVNEEGEPDVALRPDPIYGVRLPIYYRVDLRFTRRTRYRGGDLRLFLEVSNVTNRTNVFGYDYFRAPVRGGAVSLQREAEGGFFIIPSFGVSWTAF